MSEFMRRVALGLSTGFIFCYFGELMFWATPDREGMTIPDVAMTWLVYSVFAYVFLCVVSVFRVRTLCSVFLAGAFFGWYEEGIFVQTMYGSPDGPFPMSISFTGLAWHALIDVCVGWYLVRMTLTQRNAIRTAGLAAAIGLFYGLWAIWWWNEPPEPMRLILEAGRTDIVFVHFCLFALSTTAVLILAYWAHNRLAQLPFRPTQYELWGLGAVTFVYFVFVTVPAAPKALWVLPPLMAVTLGALYGNRRVEVGDNAIGGLSAQVPPMRFLWLFLIPVVAMGIYFVGLAVSARLHTNLIVYYVAGVAGALFWVACVVITLMRARHGARGTTEPGDATNQCQPIRSEASPS